MSGYPQIECKKHAYRQTQDGVVISFVLHPNDVSAELAAAPLGTRYMIVLVEMNDNETAKPPANHKLAQQAGILCGEPSFRKFLAKYSENGMPPDEEEAPAIVRELCGVKSRSELDTSQDASRQWHSLKGEYEAWMAL